MIFDLSVGNAGPTSEPRLMADTARAADELGFRALWASDHLLPPRAQANFARVFEPLSALSYLAAVTSRIRLGTSVIVAPMRDPFLLAKQAARLDHFSNGRLILGMGVGWSAEEYANVHADFHHRGARMDEMIALF